MVVSVWIQSKVCNKYLNDQLCCRLYRRVLPSSLLLCAAAAGRAVCCTQYCSWSLAQDGLREAASSTDARARLCPARHGGREQRLHLVGDGWVARGGLKTPRYSATYRTVRYKHCIHVYMHLWPIHQGSLDWFGVHNSLV